MALLPWQDVAAATDAFRRDGVVLLRDALPPAQVEALRRACSKVFDEVASFDVGRRGSRGASRYGLGALTALEEWAALIDNPRVTPIIDAIWGHDQCQLLRCGMNGSFPGCADQDLHIDIGPATFGSAETAPLPIQQMPLFSLTVHYPAVDLCKANGTIRFVPGSQRWTALPPCVGEERARLASPLRCPAGTAILNDVRTWHGGCCNTATPLDHPLLGVGAHHARPMPNAQYSAPWFMRPEDNHRHLPRRLFDTLSPRGKHLARSVVLPSGAPEVHPLAHGLAQIGFGDDDRAVAKEGGGEREVEARRIISTLANRI